jgi:hypothetical protein
MGEKYASEGGGDSLSKTALSPEWQALIPRLWESDGKSIVGFLPEIVALIKATKSAAMAERGLLRVLHSPKVQSKKLVLQGPAKLTPGYQALKLYCDAAGLPLGKVQATAIEIINALSKEVTLSERQIMDVLRAVPKTKADVKKLKSAETRFSALLDVLPEDGPDEAAAQRAKRARRMLGISRGPGRPKKNGQE